MKKLFKQFSIFTAVFAVAALVGADAFAADGYSAGKGILADFVGNLSGTAGTTVGLLISLVGLYMWIWNQVSWGIVVAIGGALITAFPGIFSNLTEGAKVAFKSTTTGATLK